MAIFQFATKQERYTFQLQLHQLWELVVVIWPWDIKQTLTGIYTFSKLDNILTLPPYTPFPFLCILQISLVLITNYFGKNLRSKQFSSTIFYTDDPYTDTLLYLLNCDFTECAARNIKICIWRRLRLQCQLNYKFFSHCHLVANSVTTRTSTILKIEWGHLCEP